VSTWTTEDGTKIYFEVHGTGAKRDTLLLLPGLLGSLSSQWRRFIPPLSPDFRLLLMDLRGHGRSTNASTGLTPSEMLQDITGLLDHLRFSAIGVSGYDFGGYLGLMLALNRPALVSSLLLHGTKFYWSKEAAEKVREQLDPDRMAANVPAYADQLVREHGARQWRLLVRHSADLAGWLAQEGLTESMVARIQCPVLVSVGDRDELVPLPEMQRLSKLFPSGQLLVSPGVRHSFQTVRMVPFLPVMQAFHKRELS